MGSKRGLGGSDGIDAGEGAALGGAVADGSPPAGGCVMREGESGVGPEEGHGCPGGTDGA